MIRRWCDVCGEEVDTLIPYRVVVQIRRGSKVELVMDKEIGEEHRNCLNILIDKTRQAIDNA